jgi:hypothetical protein
VKNEWIDITDLGEVVRAGIAEGHFVCVSTGLYYGDGDGFEFYLCNRLGELWLDDEGLIWRLATWTGGGCELHHNIRERAKVICERNGITLAEDSLEVKVDGLTRSLGDLIRCVIELENELT